MKEATQLGARFYRMASFAFVVLVFACSSSDATDPPPPYEVKSLGTLTPDEQKRLCAEVASLIESRTSDPAYIAGSCRLNAISSASLNASTNHLTVDQMRGACRTEEAQCNSQVVAPFPSSRGCAYPAACTATVADVKNCTTGTYSASLQYFGTLPSCDAVELDTVRTIGTPANTSAADCSKVTACGLPN